MEPIVFHSGAADDKPNDEPAEQKVTVTIGGTSASQAPAVPTPAEEPSSEPAEVKPVINEVPVRESAPLQPTTAETAASPREQLPPTPPLPRKNKKGLLTILVLLLIAAGAGIFFLPEGK